MGWCMENERRRVGASYCGNVEPAKCPRAHFPTLLTTFSLPNHPPLSLIPCILSFFNSSMRVFLTVLPLCCKKNLCPLASKGRRCWPSQLSAWVRAEETGWRRPDLGIRYKWWCERVQTGNFSPPNFLRPAEACLHFHCSAAVCDK